MSAIPIMPEQLKRVVVVGTSCAGKTTLAGRVASNMSAVHHELDASFWGANWTQTPRDRFRAAVAEMVSGDEWVIDGNYSTVRDLTWSRATAVIWLNYSFGLIFSRALRRTCRRVFRREVIFSGNRESFQNAFLSKDSILWWVITTFRRQRRSYRQLIESGLYAPLSVIEFRNPDEAEDWLSSLEKGR